MRGAEAVLSRSTFEGKECLIKERIEKKYRNKELDEFLRKGRTRREARILKRCAEIGINCPKVYETDEYKIKISFIGGERAPESEKVLREAGKVLAELHNGSIIHGDFTLANLVRTGDKIYVIDFGLGYFSHKIEDKAVDVFTMLRSLHSEKHRNVFLEEYSGKCREGKKVLNRIKVIEGRVRYS
ncbi:Kae1-associated serine/threonine protein kinase [Candidatus Micrarchaeota archaeon]|nr:Kae1-associated serine/threonine protein kinase [Candidatus Micrarchaeota archaeon]